MGKIRSKKAGGAGRVFRVRTSVNRSMTYGREALAGIARFARVVGWQLDVEWDSDVVPNAEMEGGQVDGLIAQVSEPEVVAAAIERGVVVVQISSRFAQSGAVRVVTDDLAIGRMAAEFLLAKGLPHYACYSLADNIVFSALRRQGFVQRMADAGIAPLVAPYDGATWRELSNRRKCWLAELPRPCGIFCVSDTLARTLIWEMRKTPVRVPEDVAVIGVDNDSIEGVLAGIELTSVDPGFDRVGYRAAEVLDGILKGGERPGETIFVPPLRVVERKSTDTLATIDPLIERAVKFIRENAHRPISVNEVAEAAEVSRRSIQRRFIGALGCSPQKQILLVHIERAKRLLADSHYAIADVAEQSGFSDHRSFSLAFRKVEGKTPTAYRKEIMAR